MLKDDAEARTLAAQVIADGGVVVFRTDTFYGLGADPFNRDALRALNELKGRDGKPILVVIGDVWVAQRFIRRQSEVFKTLSAHHWPGPLTLVGEADGEVPTELTAGEGTVGVRLPDDERVRGLVRACGGALTATSANPAGEPPARTAQEALRYFQGRVELVLDDGEARSELPSTVVDATGAAAARLIREGALAVEQIRRTLNTAGAGLV